MEESRERPRDGAKGRGGEKEVKGRKSLKKVLQYGQKSTNCLFSHIKGGGKKTIFATGGTSGAEKYSPERRRGEIDRMTRKGKEEAR